MAEAAEKNKAGGVRPHKDSPGVPGWMLDLAIVLAAVFIALAVYSNTLQQSFVYDDDRQIVQNVFLQDSGLFWKAMFSDVWAFKGARDHAWSNYWRPTFVLWMMLNERLFGVANAVGWHVTNVLLHSLVVGLSYAFVRRLGASRAVGAAIVLVFAVHPAHVESVAWVSGSPDMLLSAALLGSWLCFDSVRRRPSALKWILSLAFYGVALLSKEVAVLFPAVIYIASLVTPGANAPPREQRRSAVLAAAPYAALAGAYIVARFFVLHAFQEGTPGGANALSILLTAPAACAFYLRQIVFPLWLGPSYPLRAVTPETIGLTNFVIPLVVDACAAALAVWIARRDVMARVGLALFICMLAPALNIGVFLPDQIVHDRYLYLALLGALMVLVPALVRLGAMAAARISRLRDPASDGTDPGSRASRSEQVVVALLVVACIPLIAATWTYSPAWASNLALWERALRTDPTSPSNWSQYAVFLNEADRVAEAKDAFDKAISIHPLTNAYMGRAEVEIKLRRFADAEADLRAVLQAHDDLWMAYERLAVCYDQQGRSEDAEATLRTAREKVPYMRCAFTEKLSVVLFKAGRREAAAAELESVRGQVRSELGPGGKLALWRLGMVYTELRRAEDARSAFRDYLDASAQLHDRRTLDARRSAESALRSLGR